MCEDGCQKGTIKLKLDLQSPHTFATQISIETPVQSH